jgi:hypothetical protein
MFIVLPKLRETLDPVVCFSLHDFNLATFPRKKSGSSKRLEESDMDNRMYFLKE